jgi:hypothetical protein
VAVVQVIQALVETAVLAAVAAVLLVLQPVAWDSTMVYLVAVVE